MKSMIAGIRRWRLPALFLSLGFLTSTVSAKVFTDPTLEAWSISKTNQQAIGADVKSVIVYLKPGSFINHSGMSLAGAIATERAIAGTALQMKAAELGAVVRDRKPKFLWASNAVVLTTDKQGLKALKKQVDIEAIVEDRIITLDDPVVKNVANKTDESKMTYGLQLIHAKEAWNLGYTGKGVTIGIIDTGVEATHPDLLGKVILQKDFTADNDNRDYIGHGTHVAGTIAGGNASGVAIGVAPDTKVIMAKVFDSRGGASLSVLLKAMEWMLDPDGNPDTADAPRLVSNSWGAGTQFTYGFRNIIRSWKRFNIFPNFAAGNSGDWMFTVNAPASYPFSYAVGAVDEKMDITSFSSRGPGLWWKVWHPQFVTKPNIAAPGFNVLSAIAEGSALNEHAEKWVKLSGTSMATPHIAGVVALALQANPNLGEEDLEKILSTSTLDRGSEGMNNRYGNGIIQADKAVEKAKTWVTTNTHSFFRDRDPSQWEWDTP